jgi:cyclopropane-fatty-acyl-phospholipid synthase
LAEQRYARYLRSVDFIQKHVFPGGCLPSVLALGSAAARRTDLRLLHLEDFAGHYARTLRAWRARFRARLDDVRAQGRSERFVRLWDYYLCYCEAAFEERTCGVVQMLFAAPDNRLDPLTAWSEIVP